MDARKLTREQIIRALQDPGYWDSLCAAEREQAPIPAPAQPLGPSGPMELADGELDSAAGGLRFRPRNS